VSGSLLSARDLSVRYGKSEAVRNVSLEIAPGQIVAVIGPNGAGKSTMLNAVMGTLPASGKVSGEILFEGESIATWAPEDRVSIGMSLVPEKRELFTGMTVEDNLELGGFRHHGAGRKGRAADLDRIYGIFPRLKERSRQLAGTLSGGERQMLALGRALMATPRALLLDEPSLGLAPLIVQEIFRVIAGLKAAGVAVLLVEQNARAALNVADYGYVLESGEVALRGSAAELANDPKVIEAYLGFGRRPGSQSA